jgi:hypothetical protein
MSKNIVYRVRKLPVYFFLSFLLTLCSLQFASAQTVTITYTTTGTGNNASDNKGSTTIPAGATSISATAIGGGGGGGGAKVKGYYVLGTTGVAAAAAGGGGSGCTATTSGLSAGNSYNIVVGRGGTGGNLSQMTSCPKSGSGFDRLTAGAGGTSSIGSVVSSGGGSPAYDTYTYSSGLGDQGGRSTNGGSGCSSTGVNGNPGSMTSATWDYTAPTDVRGGKGGNNSSENGGLMQGGSGGDDGQTGIVSGAGGGGAAARASGTSSCEQATGGDGASGKVTITFNLPRPTFTMSSPACAGQNVTFTLTSTMISGFTYTLYNGSVSKGTFSSDTLSILAEAGTYTVRATITISQTGGSLTTANDGIIANSGNTVTIYSEGQTLTVNPTPDITVNSQSICSDNAFNFAASNLGSDIATISWGTPTYTAGDLTGTPLTAATDQTALAGTLTNTTAGAKTITYAVTPKSSEGCVGVTENINISVGPIPNITSLNLNAICSGEGTIFNPGTGVFASGTNIPAGTGTFSGIVTANTDYTWIIKTNNTNITGQTAQATWQSTFSTGTLTNSTTTAQTIEYTISYRHSTASCSTLVKTIDVTVTVNPTPSFTLNSPLTTCQPNTIDLSNGFTNLNVGTMHYYNTLVGSNPTGEITSGISAYATGGTHNIHLQAATAAGCKSAVQTLVVTINPQPVINGGATAVCEGSTTPAFTADIAGGSWSITPTSVATINASSGEVTGVSAGTATITYTVTATGCTATKNITVNPTPAIETSGITTSFCAGETQTFALTSATAGLTGGTWGFVTTPIASTINATSGLFTAGNITLAQSPASISIQYASAATDGGCVSNPVAVTVKHRPAAPATVDMDQCLSASGSVTWASRVTLGDASYTLQWYNPFPSNPISEPAAVDITTASSATYYVTQNYNGCESTTASSVRITVAGTSTIASFTAYSHCATTSGATSLNVEDQAGVTPPAGTTLSWYSDAAGLHPTAAPNFNPQTAGTQTWYAQQTTGGCVSNIYGVTVEVKPRPTATLTGTATICKGQTTPLTVTFGTNGTYNFTIDNGVGGVQDIATNPYNINVTPTASTTYTITALTDGTCSAVPVDLTGAAIITVNPLPTVSISGLDATGKICKDNPVTLTFTGTTPYNLDYTVNGNPASSVGLTSPINGISTNTINITAGSTGTFNFALTALTDGNGCAATAIDPQQIIVKDKPEITGTFTLSPQCEGNAFEIESEVSYIPTNYNNGTNGGSYWIISQSSILTDPYAETVFDILYNENSLLNGLAAVTAARTLQYADSGKWIGLVVVNECGTDTLFEQLSVIQRPLLHDLSVSGCSEELLVLTPPQVTGDVVPTGSTFRWDRHINNTNLASTSENYSQPTGDAAFEQTITNLTNTAQTITYHVKAEHQGCVSNEVSYVVTINPKPAIANKTYTICSGAAFTMSAGINDVVPAGTTYTWTVSSNTNISGQSDVLVSTGTVSQPLTNTTNDNQQLVYTVTPTAGSCAGTPFTVTVTVHPRPKVTMGTSADLCKGEGCTLTFVGAPNFTLDYTVNGNTPAIYGLGTTFDTSGADYILTPVAGQGQTYTTAVIAGSPGVFNFKLLKITDGNGCESMR